MNLEQIVARRDTAATHHWDGTCQMSPAIEDDNLGAISAAGDAQVAGRVWRPNLPGAKG